MIHLYKKIMSKIFLIKIGSDSRPASQEDLDIFKNSLEEALKDEKTTYIISGHEVDIIELFKEEKEIIREELNKVKKEGEPIQQSVSNSASIEVKKYTYLDALRSINKWD